METNKTNADAESTSPANRDSGEESDDESEILEESPCGRWQKRREVVEQRDVPGIDNAFLAMDSEEGVEVVWNEVCISENKASKSQLDKIKQVFDNLIQLEHANIVKFHKYWTDTESERPRVIFITEYMSSGSLKQFLKKTKKNNKTIKAWKRWCTQILSALTYLHSCDPPIIHGNLKCDTIFIQHNGLIKIGSVAPDAIYHHVKTYKEEARNMHYIAPDYGNTAPVTTAVDIYSFGICALEMAALEIQGNGDSGTQITDESIRKTLESLEDPRQRDFIDKCLQPQEERPSAHDLLFHEVLFEVHSLRLLAGHTYVRYQSLLPEITTDELYHFKNDPNHVIAEIIHKESGSLKWTVAQTQAVELDKFLEDVKNGVYPLVAFGGSTYRPNMARQRAMSPDLPESVKSETPEPADNEARLVQSVSVTFTTKLETISGEERSYSVLNIALKMDDKMNRNLTCEIRDDDSASLLAEDLVNHGFINLVNKEWVATEIEKELKDRTSQSSSPGSSSTNHLVSSVA